MDQFLPELRIDPHRSLFATYLWKQGIFYFDLLRGMSGHPEYYQMNDLFEESY